MFRLVDQLKAGLDGSLFRHDVLSHNLANANTPGFKRSDVDFPSQLRATVLKDGKQQLSTTHSNHLRRRSNGPVFKSSTDSATTMRNDGNNVDMDREMVLLMENQLHYQAMADAVSRKLSLLRSVVGEGRR